MLCKTCLEGLEGIWDPAKTKRVGLKDKKWNKERLGSFHKDSDWQDTDDRPEPERHLFAHHLTKEMFEESIKQGCVMCCRFQPLMLKDKAKEGSRLEATAYFSVFTILLKRERVLMTIHFGDCIGGFDLIPQKEPDPDLNFDLGISTAEESTWAMISRWLERCVQTHTDCNNQVSQSSLPSRLLELRTEGSEKVFRVVESSQCEPGSRYITLSHRWGSGVPDNRLMLKKSTEKSFMADQPLSVLPRTFRDAFTIVDRLKIRYLWIDSLCIFQDSEDDWRRESATMRDVYGSAFLNISALGAEDDNSGCLFSRNPDEVTATIVNLCIDGPDNPEPYRFELEKGWAWRLTFEKEPLLQRGWALQERLLSPRVLHFGRKQVFWECRECNCCELHPNTVYDSLHSPNEVPPPVEQHGHIWKQLLDAPDRRHASDPMQQLLIDWDAIIMKYSECQLTFPRDKLVAVSGLAKDMKAHLRAVGCESDIYLAGLWRQELPTSLIWWVQGAGQRPPIYRAPSWSWASVDGKICNLLSRGDKIQALTSIVEAECTVRGQDDTEEVSGGSITFKGPLASATLIPFGVELRRHFVNYKTIQSLRSLGEGEDVQVLEHSKNGNEKDAKDPTVTFKTSWDVMFDVGEEMCEEVYCLPIIAEPSHRDSWVICGMALSQTANGRYVRVGCTLIHVKSEEAARSLFASFPKATCVVV